MPEDITVRLPPNLIIKLERRAAHIGVTPDRAHYVHLARFSGKRPAGHSQD